MKDHREIGKVLDLFMFSDLSPGNPIWLHNGNILYSILSQKIREFNLNNGYVEVRTPILWKAELFETSGHLDHYRKNMFIIKGEETVFGDEWFPPEPEYILKPMNCPAHMEIFRSKQWSYRDLPYRIHDQGMLHRNEASGAVGGLTRCRSFCQDDAHCFVTPETLHSEIVSIVEMTAAVYRGFGMTMEAKLSTRPDKFMGEKEQWDMAEKTLENVLKNSHIAYELNPGDGAFYGPKIDFTVTDAFSRAWQTATIQLDFQLPQRFGLKYVGEDNDQHTPIVVHRAMYGSFERFIGILLEHYQGKLPFWLSPIQAVILPISDRHLEYATMVQDVLADFRVNIDKSSNTLPHKVAVAEAAQTPYILVVGDREVSESSVNVRSNDRKTITLPALHTQFSREDFFQFHVPQSALELLKQSNATPN